MPVILAAVNARLKITACQPVLGVRRNDGLQSLLDNRIVWQYFREKSADDFR